MNIQNLRQLGQCTGSECLYVNPIGKLRYSEGVKFLADNTDCYWPIDAIASYQPQLLKIETFQYLQFWNLIVNPDHSCVSWSAGRIRK